MPLAIVAVAEFFITVVVPAVMTTLCLVAASKVVVDIVENVEGIIDDVRMLRQGAVTDEAETIEEIGEELSKGINDSITAITANTCDIINSVQNDISSLDTQYISNDSVIDKPNIETFPADSGVDIPNIEIFPVDPGLDIPNIETFPVDSGLDVPYVETFPADSGLDVPYIETFPAEKSKSIDDLMIFTKVDYGSTDLSMIAIKYRISNGIYTGRNVAVFEYEDGNVVGTIVKASERGVGHAERLAAKELLKLGIDSSKVTRIYSELEPCCMPGGYCKKFIKNTFPQAEVTYTFDYGVDKVSRVEGINALKESVKLIKENYMPK